MIWNITVKTAKILLAVSIVAVSACKNAQKSQQSATTVKLDPVLSTENSLLWQISGNGLTKPSFLFGTIHVIAADDYYLGENVVKKLSNSDVLVLEMDLAEMNTSELAMASLLPEGKTIADYMDPDDYQVLENFFVDSIGFTPELFKNSQARIKPFYLEQMIYFHFLGENPESFEKNFTDIAEDQQIIIGGLETLKEQLSYLESLPIETQLESLVNTLRNYTEESGYMKALIKAYKSQNIALLSKMIYEHEDGKDFTDSFLDARNEIWIPRLERFFTKGSCFIAVGAGHLAGEKGLITLLRNKGFTVEPISID